MTHSYELPGFACLLGLAESLEQLSRYLPIEDKGLGKLLDMNVIEISVTSG